MAFSHLSLGVRALLGEHLSPGRSYAQMALELHQLLGADTLGAQCIWMFSVKNVKIGLEMQLSVSEYWQKGLQVQGHLRALTFIL